MNQRRWAAAALVIALAGTSAPAAASAPHKKLPPSDRESLAAIFDPKVEDLGFRTTRALLQNLDTYAPDPKGEHLAIYLEPTADTFSDDEYVESFMKTARVFLPMIYKRWKGLKSFDVCLEPLPSEDSTATPPPVTQLLVTRKGVREVDWKDATLVDVLLVAEEYEDDPDRRVYVYFTPQLAQQPDLAAAQAEADQRG